MNYIHRQSRALVAAACVVVFFAVCDLATAEQRLLITAHQKADRAADSYNSGFETRRAKLLDMLSSGELLQNDHDSGHYSTRRSWQYHNACLAKGIFLPEANAYFAESKDIVADEWPILQQLRTYFAFKDTVLSPAAQDRLAKVMAEYKEDFHRMVNVESAGTNGNHSIVNLSAYLLIEQELGKSPQYKIARENFIAWVRYQGSFARDEVNSPHYLERSLLPLMNIYDFTDDDDLKLWAQMAIDQMLAEFASLSLDNVRGGPWCRAHQNHTPGLEEINNGTQDGFYGVGYLFFGNSAFPGYNFTDQQLHYGFITTTNYRPARAIVEMADRNLRGTYEYKSHCHTVKWSLDLKEVPEWDMYYYLTPSYSLGAVQNREELDNYTNGREKDFRNSQVWELSFSDPMKILGPQRDLGVTTGDHASEKIKKNNPNTANMQFKNVLFYKGAFMDYNDNLADGGGEYVTERSGQREYHFWRIPTSQKPVFVGITHFPEAGGGILEVGTRNATTNFKKFQRAIKGTESSCRDTGLETAYTSIQGDNIVFNHGKATVNGESWPIADSPLYESPRLNSKVGSGLIEMAGRDSSVILDFRDPRKPLRIVKQAVTSSVSDVSNDDAHAATDSSQELYFREDWQETPEEVPLSQSHVANDQLVVTRHGPAADMIKKSHHDNVPNDPWYVWSGLCRKGHWAVSLRKKGALVDLSQGGRIRWRTKQAGPNVLKLVLELDDGTWLVSDRGFGETPHWHTFDLNLQDQAGTRNELHWHQLDIKEVKAGARVKNPDLSRVRSVGWTDLTVGKISKGCTRVDWIEVYGKSNQD